jgi:hypothetical protein
MVDSRGRVIFLAKLGIFNSNTALLRCNSLGAVPEKLAVFKFPGFDPTPGYPDPFPDKYFLQFNGLHLETTNQVVIDDNAQNGLPQISGGDSYVFSFSPPGPNTGPAGSLRYFPDANQWVDGPSVGNVGKAGGQGWTPDMAFHDGMTYVALADALLRDKNGLHVSASGHAGNADFSLSLTLFGGSAEFGPNTTWSLNDRNTPDLDSGCLPNPPASNLTPYTGSFTSLSGIYNVVYDEYTDSGLVLESGDVSAGFPFLTQVSEALLDNPSDLRQYFTHPGLGCQLAPEIYFTSVLPFFGQKGINGFHPMVSSTQGIVGVAGNRIAALRVGDDPTDEQFLTTPQPWLSGSSGLGAWPPKVSSGNSADVIIRVNSPVNTLVTGPDGRKIGVDDSGQPVNDFGNDGFDSGPGEPRFFAINNPMPGTYGLQVIGTGNGPFAVHIYSNDMALPVGDHIVTTGSASVGSSTSADFKLAPDLHVSFISGSNPNGPISITVTAATDAKVYDGTTSSSRLPTITSGSLVGGDTASFTQTFGNKNVGTNKTLTPAGSVSDGNGGNNYTVTFVNNNTGVITALAITGSITADDKAYDGTNTAAIHCTLAGVLANDAADVSCSGTGSFSDANAGANKTVTSSNLALSGSASGNYVLSTATATSAATIKKAAATISVTPYNVTYDGAAHTATGNAKGVSGESLSGLDLSGTTHTNAGTTTDTWTFTDVTGNYNNASGTVSDSIAKATSVVTWNPPASMPYGTPLGLTELNATANVPGTFAYNPAAGTLLGASPSQPLSANFTPTDTVNYNSVLNIKRTIEVLYQSGGICYGGAGHQILQPINASGTMSVFKMGSTVPTKFRVCDANGASIGTPGVVTSYGLAAAASSPSITVDEDSYSTTPDTAFRWDSTGQQWIFNQSTKNNPSLNKTGVTYFFTINLNDGSSIYFQYGLK